MTDAPDKEWIERAIKFLCVTPSNQLNGLALAREFQAIYEAGVGREKGRAEAKLTPPAPWLVQIWSLYHSAWWRPEAAGYTTERSNAGWYHPIVAERHCLSRTGPNGPYEIIVKPDQSLSDAINALTPTPTEGERG